MLKSKINFATNVRAWGHHQTAVAERMQKITNRIEI